MLGRAVVVAGLASALAGCGGASAPTARAPEPVERPAEDSGPGNAIPTDSTHARERILRRERRIGRSSGGRPIRLVERGLAGAEAELLIVGCIHGTECAGTPVVRRLARAKPLQAARLSLLENLNPDGLALDTRTNRRGVDLNRNFPSEWRPSGRPFDPEYPGPHPLSEPETRLAARLVRARRPTVTIWFHQPQALVRAWGQSIPIARRYAKLADAPYRSIRWPAGTAPNWQNHRFDGATSFVVELPPGPLGPAGADRYASAVRQLARELSDD